MEFDTSSTDSSTDSSQNSTTSNNMFDTLKELLTPEQQTMFNTYSALFSS
jgi:hypothetical protein